MSESFQPPNPERFKWERHTVVMEPPDLDTNREGAFVVGGQDTHPSRQNREPSRPKDVGGEAWESALASWLFWQVIIAAAEDLVPPLPVSTALSREQARKKLNRGTPLFYCLRTALLVIVLRNPLIWCREGSGVSAADFQAKYLRERND